jgi:glycosyltransferase involved in cell wall biosynthesis
VSVVIPAYNRADSIERAVRSAQNQEPARPAEVIVVDDASSDATATLAEGAGATVIRHAENGGEGKARNTGIRAAAYDWIALLDSDDEWLPNHLASLWPLRADRVVVGSTAIVRGHEPHRDRLWGRGRNDPLPLRSPRDVLTGGNALVVASTVMVHRGTAIAAGGFSETLQRGADLDLWLRVLELGRGTVSSAITVVYHVHEGQASEDRAAMWQAHREIVRSYAGHPWCTSSVRRASDAILRWDELRASLRAGKRAHATSIAASLLTDPVKVASVAQLLRHRHQLRRRTARHRRFIEGVREASARDRAPRAAASRGRSAREAPQPRP